MNNTAIFSIPIYGKHFEYFVSGDTTLTIALQDTLLNFGQIQLFPSCSEHFVIYTIPFHII